MVTLDVDAVRAFVLTADLRSFTRAAEALGSTQSAVSVKIGRLERGLGRRLLDRTPRLVRLSSDGAVFLRTARALVAAHGAAISSFDQPECRLKVGISHHVVGTELTPLLKRLYDADPGLVIDIRIASSREVLDNFDSGTLDAGIVLRHDSSRRDGEILSVEAFGWMSSPDFQHSPDQPLRLATQADPCSVRAMAINALEGHAVSWTEAFVGGGVATIGAAAAAGLAVAALGRGVAPAATVDVGPRLGLPSLPSREIILHAATTDARTKRSLQTFCAAFRASRHPANPGRLTNDEEGRPSGSTQRIQM